jgi:arginine/lysine/ornithine decarboxylase
MKHRASPTNSSQSRAPLFEALADYITRSKIPFHTPGHKQGKGIDPEWLNLVGKEIFKMDLTVLPETDCLFHPTGPIKEAQKLAAKAYHADSSYFLVNGSTGGNLTMLMGTLFPNDKVIVPRHTHKSVIAGLIMTGALPVYVHPEVNREWELILNLSSDKVEKALGDNPGARAVFVSSPTYHGICCDLETIARQAHLNDRIVMVDQAHGPHLLFHPAFPTSAMEAGADICVESSHKIIPALTQASMLHVKGSNIDMRDLQSVLLLTQSTSPSYLLMASLDLARRQMALHGRKLLDRTISLSEGLRKAINRIKGLYCLKSEDVKPFRLDPTKITVFVDNLGISGYTASKILNQKYEIQAEMADWDHVAFIITMADGPEEIERLLWSLKELAWEYRDKKKLRKFNIQFPSNYPPMSLTPREAYFASYRTVLLKEAVGEIPTEFLTVYPPGIPVIVPGERITREAVDYLEEMRKLGAIIVGPGKVENGKIRVVA